MTNRTNIAQRFDRAAASYDGAASVQAEIASSLVKIAAQKMPCAPVSILDIGCGTGFAAAVAAQRWPRAAITAIDGAPAMLKQAQRKIPHLRLIEGNIAERRFEPQFDLILSSMVLHWLPKPRAVLENWRKGLKPNGRLFAAALIKGSFQEWRTLCAAEKLEDGLWVLPHADFANDLITKQQSICVNYSSAKDFLHRLKTIGAATSRPDHRPFNPAAMRRMLAMAPQPFVITYRVVYIEAPSPSPDSI